LLEGRWSKNPNLYWWTDELRGEFTSLKIILLAALKSSIHAEPETGFSSHAITPQRRKMQSMQPGATFFRPSKVHMP
jgi:hypothetical protein